MIGHLFGEVLPYLLVAVSLWCLWAGVETVLELCALARFRWIRRVPAKDEALRVAVREYEKREASA